MKCKKCGAPTKYNYEAGPDSFSSYDDSEIKKLRAELDAQQEQNRVLKIHKRLFGEEIDDQASEIERLKERYDGWLSELYPLVIGEDKQNAEAIEIIEQALKGGEK